MTEERVPRPVQIQILDKRDSGPLMTFRAQVVRIGRDPGCEICFDDPSVSRVHCAIHCQGDRAMLVVGHSRNPTFVNGERASNIELKPGDDIGICDHRLRYQPQLVAAERDGPRTIDHLGSRRKAAGGGAPDPLSPNPALPEISLDGLEDDDEDSLDLVPNAPVELEADPGSEGRSDDQHTRVLPRKKPGGQENSDRGLPHDGAHQAAPPPRATGPAQLGAGARDSGQHTQVLPRGQQQAPRSQTPAHAVILSDPTQAPPGTLEDDAVDPQRLSVAIQEATDGMAGEGREAAPERKGALKSNGVRIALLLLMLAMALLAWKDSIFPSKASTPSAVRDVQAAASPLVVGDRSGRADAELMADAQKYLAVGSKKLEEHHLQDENLTLAIRQLLLAKATLQLLANPGQLMLEVDEKLREAEELREQKYRDALFHYQKLKRQGSYREGQEELTFIMRLIADEADPRYQDAAREAAQIEEMMKDARR